MPRLTRLVALIAVLGSAALGLAACQPAHAPTAFAKVGDAVRGQRLTLQMGCGACHEIPGVSGAHGLSGPPLEQMGERTIIAGLLPNTPPNMIRWLKSPQSIVPGNAMPNTGLDDRDAADVAAFLYTLR